MRRGTMICGDSFYKGVKDIVKTYSTAQIAKIIGIHPNTVRLYEEWGMIARPARRENGYRIFTDQHIYQFKIARTALKTEVLQNGLRKKAVDIIKAAAKCDFDAAGAMTDAYVKQIDGEIARAGEAVSIVKEIYSDKTRENTVALKRREASLLLDITMDTLRNWEMNGLVRVKRKANGYRVYTDEDIRRLKIIRTLRCANYSLSAILRMLNALDKDRTVDIDAALSEPAKSEDIISACDRLTVSLGEAKRNALHIKELLQEIKNNPPL